MAYPQVERLIVSNGTSHLAQVGSLSPALSELFGRELARNRQGTMELAGEP